MYTLFGMGDELSYYQQWGGYLYSIFLMVAPIILAIGILLPVILLASSRGRKLKKVNLDAFLPNGALNCNDQNVRSVFAAAYMKDGNFVLVAQPTTTKASITLVTNNNKIKTSDLVLDFKKGNSVEIPVRSGINSAAIIVNGVNGRSVKSENSINPSSGLLVFAALFPAIMGLLSCASQIVDMFFMLSDESLAVYDFMFFYILTGVNVILFPISYLIMRGMKK